MRLLHFYIKNQNSWLLKGTGAKRDVWLSSSVSSGVKLPVGMSESAPVLYGYLKCERMTDAQCTDMGDVKSIGVNPAGDAGDVSPLIFWLVGTSMGMSPPIFGVAM